MYNYSNCQTVLIRKYGQMFMCTTIKTQSLNNIERSFHLVHRILFTFGKQTSTEFSLFSLKLAWHMLKQIYFVV